jgi:DNA ligase (NAD+)
MEALQAKARMDALVEEINCNDRLYYVEARPVVSDADYDRMYEELIALEREFPEFKDPNSPTVRVSGASIEGFAQVRHEPPMKSLDKCYEKGDLVQFDAFLSREMPQGADWRYVVEPKVDGVSMSLLYEDRRLVRAATRGNGEVGDDVTQNVRTIRTIPKTLPEDAPSELEVRGEVYMTRDGFVRLNESLDEAGRPTFMNPRNACAGSLKLLDPKVVATRPLDMVVYNSGGVGCEGFATHIEMLDAFRRWGFPVTPWFRTADTIGEAVAAIDELGGRRHDFRFEIDGAVLKVNERSLYAALGATAHSPRWARAYKYAPERAETIVRGITVQVGRSGVLTPVAELEPVELAGSVISRATLHNADQIAEQDIRVGDHVWIVKAGDVIPAIDGVLTEKRTPDVVPYEFPSSCPVCGGEVARLDGEVAVRCQNPGCPAQLQRRLQHFASRNALDIKALGGRVADLLVEKGLVKDPLDLFSLDYDALAGLDVGEVGTPRKFGRNAANMKAAVEAARSLPLDRWLFATGIAGVGATVARDIADAHEKMSDLPGSPVLEEVLANDGRKGRSRLVLPIKVEAAKAVLAFFAGEYGRSYLERLLALGIDPHRAAREAKAVDGPLVGLGCVLTGSLSRPRQEYARLIELAGGVVQSAVTSKTRYLIAGANVGAAKTEKAKALGTEVIDEARLLELLGKSGETPVAAPSMVVQDTLF